MNDESLTTLFRHNLWANSCLFDVCAGLSEEQLDAKIVGTYGTIRDTLQHIVNAEKSYLSRIQTGHPFRRPEGAPPMTMTEMEDAIRASGEGLIESASKVSAQDRVDIKWVDGAQRSVPLTIIVTQAINHATEHRAQIMTTLTQLGIEPPNIDSWTYFASNG
jgi:uncharacterized damage-inducible protein DinB